MTAIDSRQVAYLPVYEFVSADLGDPLLIPGTPRWCELDDADPVKRQALLWPVIWWALNEDVRQMQMAEASRHIAASTDWTAVARRARSGRGAAYIPRKAS